MLRETDSPGQKITKLTRINEVLIRRLESISQKRGPAYALSRAAEVLEREVVARNLDLETALAELALINTELANAREVADQANRAKSRFLRAASHDLLQPLSAAKLFLAHLREVSGDALQRDLVSHLTATIDSAEELIRALLQIAKLDSRSFQTNLAPVAMGRLFRRLIIDTQPVASARRIDLRFVGSKATVLSDGVYLRQIAQNLITNALKYTTGRKVLVGLRHDRNSAVGPAVWFEVLDQGPGIAPADQTRIFNEFERLSLETQPGTGLGLSIVQRACDQLDHRLELISHPGLGSRFRVRLPLVQTPSLPAMPAEAPDMPRADLTGRRVLLIENDQTMRQAMQYLLESWGMIVWPVAGSDEAVQVAMLAAPDLILSDYRLDGEDTGMAAIRRLSQELALAPPALIVSAEPADMIRRKTGDPGLEILEKPVAAEDLNRAIRHSLGVL
ncbi:hybrid sensor histidine kinase/response regulator [Rhodobacter sp. 24-YEA-8]|uniref:ATP-binding response regulator n=1 Tax=Rhodobacter sp. 24-YEA-8 TaxID=1884310 RepID=UPI0008967486|nr:hybrid sensor histidine kinase/response regulator [Rhodobacter sp. 24-YEA-8]SED59134.1 Signal transduction histidine kinase [Rhodobacter sp. 24-YEA-8]